MTPQTPTPPPQSIVERLGAVLVGLVMGISGRVSWGGISHPVSILVTTRLSAIKRTIDRIVAKIRAGTYKPRQRTVRPGARASPPPRKPRAENPLPAKFGWLMPLIPVKPEEYWHANGFSQGVEAMLNSPEMVALVEAAPVSLGRPLRSLCWAFRIKPPPHLAPPRRPPPRAAAPRKAKPRPSARPKVQRPAPEPPPPPQPQPPPPPAPPALPDWLRDWPLAGWRSRFKNG